MINDLRDNFKETLIMVLYPLLRVCAFLIVAMLKKAGILEFMSIKEY